MSSRRDRRALIGAVLLAGLVAAAIYGLTATNTVPPTEAGSGTGAISGYTLTNVAYGLNTTDPSKIDAVTFTLNAAATTAKVQLLSDAGTDSAWFDCTIAGGTSVTCDTSPGATVGYPLADADDLNTVIAS